MGKESFQGAEVIEVKEIDRINKNATATIHNDLIQARHRLSLEELRLMDTIISFIQPDDENFKIYRIPVSVLKELYESERHDIYDVVKRTLQGLLSKPIKIETKGKDGKKELIIANFISDGYYKEGKGFFEVSISPRMKPFLLQFKDFFTRIPLKYTYLLRSTYAVRLYELLKQYENTGYRIDKLEDLREMLGVEENEYKRFFDFEKRVLKKAVEEINEKTDLEVSYEKKKTGRKITHIEFTIHSKNANEIEDTQTEKSHSESIDTQALYQTDLLDTVFEILMNVFNANEEEIQFLKDYAIAHYKTDTNPKQMIIDTMIIPELREDRERFLDLLFKYLPKIKSIVKTETNSNYDVKISEELIKSVQ